MHTLFTLINKNTNTPWSSHFDRTMGVDLYCDSDFVSKRYVVIKRFMDTRQHTQCLKM